MLGVNPSQVAKPSNIREFKVDWSFRSWRLKPNLALQAQPIWEILYNRADMRRYRRANNVMKTLSTLDISAGTVEDDDLTRRVSLSAKINLFRAKDPLSDENLFLEIDTTYRREQLERMEEINEYNFQSKRTKDYDAKLRLLAKVDSVEAIYDTQADAHKVNIQQMAQNYLKNFWNASHVDLAYGRVYTYEGLGLDSLNLRGEAQAVWVNGSVGIGRKILLTGLVRYTVQQKKDSLGAVIGKGNVFSGGFSFRFGSPKFNFFAETVISKGDSPKAITDKSLNITQLGHISISYGGDWRISRNVLLTYGVRTDYTPDFKFKNLIPVAGISCMMR